MSNEILYILLPDFAAHEMVYLMEAVSSDAQQLKSNPKYVNRIVAPSLSPVTAIGGFKVIPDYSISDMPDDYAALVLVGGYGWLTPAADEVVPVGRKGASVMARAGFLNNIRHTGNGPDQLKLWGGDSYTYPDGYVHRQAVTDGSVVTANGSGVLEFTRELLLLLENDTPEQIEMYYQFNRQGFCSLFPRN